MNTIKILMLVAVLSPQALSQIELPKTPQVVLPDSPKVEPKTIDTIAKGTLYVVESSVPLIQLEAPQGFLSVISAKGPLSIYGIFADGGPGLEMRQYTSDNILIVTGVVSGKTELILIPIGVTEKSAIVRQVLTVDGARPPPEPKPDIPDVGPDEFDNIGQRIAKWSADLPKRVDVGRVFLKYSVALASNPTMDITTAMNAVSSERLALLGSDAVKYNDCVDKLNADIKARWPMAKGVLSDYMKAVSIGFRAK